MKTQLPCLACGRTIAVTVKADGRRSGSCPYCGAYQRLVQLKRERAPAPEVK